MIFNIVPLGKLLKQYRIEHWVQPHVTYRQVTVSKYDGVSFRGQKIGSEIGRKRQFLIDLKKYPNTLVFVRQGVQDGSIGLAPLEVEGCIVTENMPTFSVENVDVDYLAFFLKSPNFFKQLKGLMPTGSAQKAIHERELLKLTIPLPELANQKILVKRLKSFERFYNTFKTELTVRTAYLDSLRHLIVEKAVKGHFNLQNLSDGSASDIIDAIQVEKEKQIAAGTLKREKNTFPIVVNEMPFQVPLNWAWAKLGDISYIKSGVTLGKVYKSDVVHMPYLRVANVQRGFLDLKTVKEISISKDDAGKYRLENNDLLIVEGGDFDKVGRCAIWHQEIKNCIHQNHIFRLSLPTGIDHRWGELYINSKVARKYFESCSKQTTNLASINKTQLVNLNFPIPPLKEQIRILSKVSDLQRKLDNLFLLASQQSSDLESLLQTFLKETFSYPLEASNVQIRNSQTDENEGVLLLAAEIIWQLNRKQTFGHIKLQKLIFLCERIRKMNLQVNFLKQAMGPYDPKLQRYLDTELEKKSWFKYDEAQTLKYQPLANAGGHKLAFKAKFGEQVESIYHLIQLFENTNSARIEIVATLFACWEEMILKNQLVNDNALLSKFYDWSEFKGNYSAEQVKNALRWMESNSIVPQLPAIIN